MSDVFDLTISFYDCHTKTFIRMRCFRIEEDAFLCIDMFMINTIHPIHQRKPSLLKTLITCVINNDLRPGLRGLALQLVINVTVRNKGSI